MSRVGCNTFILQKTQVTTKISVTELIGTTTEVQDRLHYLYISNHQVIQDHIHTDKPVLGS